MSDCITADDPEPMGPQMEIALDNDDCNGLAALACYWRSRAAKAEGKCEGLAGTIEYLRERLATLEFREAECNRT